MIVILWVNVRSELEYKTYQADMRRLMLRGQQRVYVVEVDDLHHRCAFSVRTAAGEARRVPCKRAHVLSVIRSIGRHHRRVDIFHWYGHGNGAYLGPSYPASASWPMHDLARTVRAVRPRVVMFDACLMGSVETLFELRGLNCVVVASPLWHGNKSYIEAPGYLAEMRGSNGGARAWVRRVVREYRTLRPMESYACVLAWDLRRLDELFYQLHDAYRAGRLTIGRESVLIGSYRPAVYDLRAVLERSGPAARPMLRALDRALVVKIKCQRVRTMSIYKQVGPTDVHAKDFLQLDWYKKHPKRVPLPGRRRARAKRSAR